MQFILILFCFFQASLLSRISMTLMFTKYIYIYNSCVHAVWDLQAGSKKKKTGCSCFQGFGIPAATKPWLFQKNEVSYTPIAVNQKDWHQATSHVRQVYPKSHNPWLTHVNSMPWLWLDRAKLRLRPCGKGWSLDGWKKIALKPLMNQLFRSLFFSGMCFCFAYIYIVSLFRSLYLCMYVYNICL